MRYAFYRKQVILPIFRNGMPVGVRSVAGCVAFSVPLHSVWRLNGR